MPINKIDPKDVDAFATVLDIQPSNLMNEYQRISSKSAIYPGQGAPMGLIYCSLKLNGEAGELAEHVGKAMRDDGLLDGVAEGVIDFTDLSDARKMHIIKEVGDCLWYLGAICRELDISLGAVAYINLCKLMDRQERDALQGSGDDR